MVRRASTQRSLVEVLVPDADKLWDPTLRRIDALLDDEVLVERIADALGRRHPQSRERGRRRRSTQLTSSGGVACGLRCGRYERSAKRAAASAA